MFWGLFFMKGRLRKAWRSPQGLYNVPRQRNENAGLEQIYPNSSLSRTGSAGFLSDSSEPIK
jgi:hypothetical protein